MKKYIYEAARVQWEKPTEPKSRFCAPATVIVYAEDETEAIQMADKQLTDAYLGTGVLLQDLHLVDSCDLPVDWNYGYGDERGTGTPADREALMLDNKR